MTTLANNTKFGSFINFIPYSATRTSALYWKFHIHLLFRVNHLTMFLNRSIPCARPILNTKLETL